ncbi:MAG: hypothetical protein WDW38_007108 [Sanguina aurantia]
MHYNAIGPRGLQAIIEAIKYQNTVLKVLDLSGNPCCSLAPPLMEELERALQRNRVIKKLSRTPQRGEVSHPPALPSDAPASQTPPRPSPFVAASALFNTPVKAHVGAGGPGGELAAQLGTPPPGETCEQGGAAPVMSLARTASSELQRGRRISADTPARPRCVPPCWLRTANTSPGAASLESADRLQQYQIAPVSQMRQHHLASEARFQHLEDLMRGVESEVAHMKSFSSGSEAWQRRIDAAGQRVAGALQQVDSRNALLERRTAGLEGWRDAADVASLGVSQVVTAITEQLLSLNVRMLKLEAHMELLGSWQQNTANAQHITEPLTHPAQPPTAETNSPAPQPLTDSVSLPLPGSQRSQAAAPASLGHVHPSVRCESRQEPQAAPPAAVMEQLTALLGRMSALEAHVQGGVAAGSIPDGGRGQQARREPAASRAVEDVPPVADPPPQEQLPQTVLGVRSQQQLQPPPPHRQQLQAPPLHQQQQQQQQPVQHQQQLGARSQQVTPRSRYKVTTPSPSPDSASPRSSGRGRRSSESLSQELLDAVTNTEGTPVAGCRFDTMATPPPAETPWFDPLPSPFQPEASPVPAAAAAAGHAGPAARSSPAPGLLQAVQQVVTTPTGQQQRPGRFGVQECCYTTPAVGYLPTSDRHRSSRPGSPSSPVHRHSPGSSPHRQRRDVARVDGTHGGMTQGSTAGAASETVADAAWLTGGTALGRSTDPEIGGPRPALQCVLRSADAGSDTRTAGAFDTVSPCGPARIPSVQQAHQLELDDHVALESISTATVESFRQLEREMQERQQQHQQQQQHLNLLPEQQQQQQQPHATADPHTQPDAAACPHGSNVGDVCLQGDPPTSLASGPVAAPHKNCRYSTQPLDASPHAILTAQQAAAADMPRQAGVSTRGRDELHHELPTTGHGLSLAQQESLCTSSADGVTSSLEGPGASREQQQQQQQLAESLLGMSQSSLELPSPGGHERPVLQHAPLPTPHRCAADLSPATTVFFTPAPDSVASSLAGTPGAAQRRRSCSHGPRGSPIVWHDNQALTSVYADDSCTSSPVPLLRKPLDLHRQSGQGAPGAAAGAAASAAAAAAAAAPLLGALAQSIAQLPVMSSGGGDARQSPASCCRLWTFGYIIYGLSHFTIHHVRFKHPLLRRWAGSHHVHHYHPDTNFGLTTPLWDVLLGTRYVRQTRKL